MDTSFEKYGTGWSREETILALYLYCQLPFAKTKRTTPEVIELANVIGRTPSAVARKLGNFGPFDQNLAKQGIKGLTHYSKLDKQIWDEFSQNWDSLVDLAQDLMSRYKLDEQDWLEESTNLPRKNASLLVTEVETTTLVRKGQGFFRRAVLSSYNQQCCICGLDLKQLLIASHIVPWSVREETRLDPQNGLSLCVLHDKLFDTGLLTLDDSLKVKISHNVNSSTSNVTQQLILAYQGKLILLPTRFVPKSEYLDWHRQNVFVM
ncbi:MAG: HNH endonuclease [Chloroflexi bacterium]|nr:MAG: HNH endonuclease [Chloroflexota bacterium]